MLKERAEFIKNILYLIDLCVLSLLFFLFYFFVAHHTELYKLNLLPDIKVLRHPSPVDEYLRAYWAAFIIWVVVLRLRGEYNYLRVQTFLKSAVGHIINGFLFLLSFASLAFLFKFDFISRVFIVLYAVSSTIWLIFHRWTVLAIANEVRKKGHNQRHILLVGTGRRAQDFLSMVARHREWGFHILGLLDQDLEMVGKKIAGFPVLGATQDLPQVLEKNIVDEVMFVVPRTWLKEIEKYILYCEAVGVPATLSTDFFDLEFASGVPREMDGMTYLTFETRKLKDPELLVKRTLDIAFSASLLISLSPILAAAATAIKLTSAGPVLFKQVRCGRNGRKFTLYKFRSMYRDAEKRLAGLKHLNEMSGPVFKIKEDPRITPLGKLLRRTSLDELPQLWNVLKGDMSLVGPRPPIPREVESYEPWQRRRLSMKPGITCIWQVTSRNESDFENWMKLDLQYIDRWSLWLDFRIMMSTIRAVLMATGR